MSEDTPAWVLRMEKATDAGWRDDVPTGYRCSAFEANEIAREWRRQHATIKNVRSLIAEYRRGNIDGNVMVAQLDAITRLGSI